MFFNYEKKRSIYFPLLKMFMVVIFMVMFSCTPTSEDIIGSNSSGNGGTITTQDKTPPTVIEITFNNITGRSFQINVKVDESSTFYYSVVATDKTIESKDKIVNGIDSVLYANFQLIGNQLKEEIVSSEFLNPSTSYKFYYVAKDSSGNFSNIGSKEFSTQALDTIAPEFTKGILSARTTTTANFETEINKNGKIYYIIVSQSSASPTSEQVKAGNDYNGVTIIKKGSSSITKVYNFSVDGLIMNTQYSLYLTSENSENPPALSTTVQKIDFSTLTGNEQEWSEGKLPKIGTSSSDVTDTSIKIYMAVKKEGKIYGVILPKGSQTPTSTQIMQGKDANNTTLSSNLAKNYTIDASNLNTYKFIQFTSLNPDTEYDIYCTSGTGTNGDQYLIEPPYKLTGKTNIADINPPTWTNGYPKYDTVTENSFKFYVAQNKLGTIYVIIVPSGSIPPSVNEIKAQSNYGNVNLVYNYTKTVNTINYGYTQTINGLTSGTSYDVYSVGESSVGVLMSNFDKKTVTTAGNPPPPAEFQSISPSKEATGVSLNPTINVTFTQNLNTSIKGTVTFNGQTIDSNKISVSGKTISIQLENLNANTTYTGISLSNFKDSQNNTVNYSDDTYSFTTGDGTPPPSVALVFPNSDFESNVEATYPSGFTVTYLTDDKKEGLRSLKINGTMGSSNGNFYSVTQNCNDKGTYTKITFWLKVNTASTKGLVIRIGSSGSNYFNINDTTIGNIISVSGSASYSGQTLNVRDWTKIELDISSISDINTLQFFLRGGSSASYDITIDHIVYE